jgi:phosphoribosylformylglycinamidine synthase subunit PurSL
VAAVTAAGLANAAHDCSDGGLGATLAEMAFAGGLGLEIDADRVPREGIDSLDQLLFSESLSRIVLTVPGPQVAAVRRLLDGVPHEFVGQVTAAPRLVIEGLGGKVDLPIAACKKAWQSGLAAVAG